jgi:hypothetical protein
VGVPRHPKAAAVTLWAGGWWAVLEASFLEGSKVFRPVGVTNGLALAPLNALLTQVNAGALLITSRIYLSPISSLSSFIKSATLVQLCSFATSFC